MYLDPPQGRFSCGSTCIRGLFVVVELHRFELQLDLLRAAFQARPALRTRASLVAHRVSRSLTETYVLKNRTTLSCWSEPTVDEFGRRDRVLEATLCSVVGWHEAERPLLPHLYMWGPASKCERQRRPRTTAPASDSRGKDPSSRAEPVAPQKNDKSQAGASKRTRGRAAGARFDRADAECFRQLHAKRDGVNAGRWRGGSRRAHRQNAVADVSSRFADRRNRGLSAKQWVCAALLGDTVGRAAALATQSARGSGHCLATQSKQSSCSCSCTRPWVASGVLRVNLRRLERSRSRRLRRRGRDVHEQAEQSDGARTRHLG